MIRPMVAYSSSPSRAGSAPDSALIYHHSDPHSVGNKESQVRRGVVRPEAIVDEFRPVSVDARTKKEKSR